MTDKQIVNRAFALVRADLDDDDTIGVLDSLEEAMLAALAGVDNVRRMVSRPVLFACNPDESGGYSRDDPKHPDWHSVHADLWDQREGK